MVSRAIHHIDGLNRAIGSVRTVDVLVHRLLRRRGPVRAHVRGSRQVIEIDPLDSDMFVAAQIFGHKEYAIGPVITQRLNSHAADLRKAGRTPIIIDGGANVGYSALYFAETFPETIVVALEPDSNAFATLERNTAGHPAIQPIHAALWSHAQGVRLQSDTAGSWGSFVGDQGQPTPSVTLHDLFAENPAWAPLVIKLDIEGAEKDVVAASPDVFRSAVCIMIEPHDWRGYGGACLSPLFKMLAERPMDTFVNGENLLLIDSAFMGAAVPR
jgi:FkbM family methyltransferase